MYVVGDCFEDHDIDAAPLTRIGEESLPSPSGDRTLAFWEHAWRRDGALGEAAKRLGIPRFLVPEQTVFSIGGGLYVHEQLWHRVERLLWFRSQLPGWNAEARLKTIWSTVNASNMKSLTDGFGAPGKVDLLRGANKSVEP